MVDNDMNFWGFRYLVLYTRFLRTIDFQYLQLCDLFPKLTFHLVGAMEKEGNKNEIPPHIFFP